MEIKDIQGNILIDVLVTEQAVKVDELMKQHSITLSWVSVTDEQLPLGAYIEYEGVRYSLLAPYNPNQSDEATYAYNPVFEHPIMRWQHIPFFFYTYSEGKVISKELDWSLTDNPANFMKAVCDAILNETGEDWSYEISADLPASASQSFSNTDIFSALNAIAGAFETEWWFDYANKIVYLSKAGHGSAVTLEVGQNVGVPQVTQSKEGYYTRFYGFGSTRNIDQSYAGANVNSIVNRRLTLDPAKYPNGYIDIREGLTQEEVLPVPLVFDDIYPRSSLTISDVKVRLMWRLDDSGEKVQIGTDSEGNPVYDQYAIWYFKIPGLSFSKDMLIEGKALSVHFNSGPLNGREFELTYHDTAKEVTTSDGTSIQVEVGDYEINFIEEGSYIIPAITGLVPMDGDAVTLFNIVMPEEYKASAYEELEQEVRKEIAKQGEDKNNYTFDSNKVAFFENNPNLAVGRAVTYKNGDYTLTTRVIKLETRLDYPFEQRITIGNAQIKGTQQTLKEEVVNANQNIDLLAAINENTEAFQQSLQRTQKAVLDSLAKWGDMWTYDAKNKAVRSKYNIISDLDVISGGDPDTEGEESKASVVVFTPILTSGKEIAKIQIDGVVQSIYAPESYEVDLSGYATESYVNTAIQNAKDTRVDELINTTIPGLSGEINSLRTDFDALNTLLNDDVSGKINTWNEVVDFLDEYSGSQDLTTILSGMNTNLTNVSNRVKTLEDMFEWDGDTIKAKASFYSIGEVSSFGLDTEGDGTGGVTALVALDDVNVSNPTDGQSLVYDLASGKWVNKTVGGGISQVTIKLGTASYDSVNGVVALPAYPTTLKNPYALTWSGHSNGSYDGSSAVNIAIPTSLPASDVYDWAKAATKPSYAFSEITGKPTTLAGYGITDALSVNGGTIKGATTYPLIVSNSVGTLVGTIFSANGANRAIILAGGDWHAAFVNPQAGYKAIGVRDDGTPFYGDGSTQNTLLHSANYASYALPLSGGTINGNLQIGAENNTSFNYLQLIRSSHYVRLNNTNTNAVFSFGSYANNTATNEKAIWMGDNGLRYVVDNTTFYDIIHSGNIGEQSVNSASKLYHIGSVPSSGFDANTALSGGGKMSNYNSSGYWGSSMPPMSYGVIYQLQGYEPGNLLAGQLAWDVNHASTTDTTRNLWWRANDNTGFSNAKWHQIAFTDSNVASATKLKTARKIWGQSFDGTSDVDGNMYSALTNFCVYYNSDKLFLQATTTGIFLGEGTADTTYLSLHGSYIRFCIGSSDKMRIANNGNVLIGTTTDNGAKLQVNGSSYIGNSSVWNHVIKSGVNSQSNNVYALKVIQGTDCGSGLYDTMIITSSDVATLRLSEADGTQIGICAGDTHGTFTSTHDFRFFTGVATNKQVYSGGGGALKVGINYGGAALYVSGDLVATGEVSSGSDARYKAIQSYVDIDIETIAKAPIINFKWNDREDDKVHLGSTAQYWYGTSLCNGVTPTDDEKLWTMGYGQIALASVVSVAKKVVNHEERIAALEKENKELKQKLNEYRYGLQ